MKAQFTLTTCTPGEAERVTGLSTTMQRDWRRREFIPTVTGHARFDAFDLAEMSVLKMLADRSIGPQTAKEVAPWCASGMLWFMLQWSDAYEGDHLRTFEWLPEEDRPRRPPTDKEKQSLDLLELSNTSYVAPTEFTWHFKADWLAKQVLRKKGLHRVVPAKFFVWWADGSHGFYETLVAAFEGSSGDPKYAGPVIVLDLYALATSTLEKIGMPIVHVDFEQCSDTGAILAPVELNPPVTVLVPTRIEL